MIFFVKKRVFFGDPQILGFSEGFGGFPRGFLQIKLNKKSNPKKSKKQAKKQGLEGCFPKDF